MSYNFILCFADILKDADLTKITSKLVRCRLEEHFKCSLTSRRDEIDQMIMRTLDSSSQGDEKSSSDDDISSDESDASLSSSEVRPLPKKRKSVGKGVSKEKAKSSSKAKLSDEELARQLQVGRAFKIYFNSFETFTFFFYF